MASGDTLAALTAGHAVPAVANSALPDYRNGHPVWRFVDGATRRVVFGTVLDRRYAGGGLTVRCHWSASSATTGNARLAAAIERKQVNVTDLDTDDFAAAQTATTACSATNGALVTTTFTFTSGAAMDDLAVGEPFRLYFERQGADAADTMVGDLALDSVEITET